MGHGFHGDLRTSHIYSKNQPGRIEFFKFGVIHTKKIQKEQWNNNFEEKKCKFPPISAALQQKSWMIIVSTPKKSRTALQQGIEVLPRSSGEQRADILIEKLNLKEM